MDSTTMDAMVRLFPQQLEVVRAMLALGFKARVEADPRPERTPQGQGGAI